MTMTQQSLVTRFNLAQIAGNNIVDWSVIEANYENLGNYAAHLTAGNSFTGNQIVAGNLGLTGVHRRLTLPVPAANETDRVMLMAEGNSANGTYVGVSAPTGAPGGQRRASLVLHGVEPLGTTTPLGLVHSVDEDNHRASINVTGTYQDLTAPILQLGAGGIDRLTLPATGAVTVTGALTLTGNLSAAAATFSTTLTVAGAASFGTTVTVTGNAQLNGALDLVGTATFHSGLSVATITSASVTLSGALTVAGTVNITATGSNALVVAGGVSLQSTLAVTGTTTLSGSLQFAAGAAYIQSFGTDTTFVQISKLTVTPGTTTLTGLTVNGNSSMTGAINATGQVFAGGGMLVPNGAQFAARDVDGTTVRGMLWHDGGNATVLQAGAANTIRIVNGPNSIQYAAWDAAGNFTMNQGSLYVPGGTAFIGGSVSAGSQVFTTPGGSLYLRGSDGNVHLDTGGATLYVNNRGVFNGYDPGGQPWGLSVGQNGIASGYWYQRARGDCRCWDNFDFNFSPNVAGSYVVQRDGNGYILANYVNMTANVAGGKPDYVVGMVGGDNFLRYWPRSAIGPPSATIHLSTQTGVPSRPYDGFTNEWLCSVNPDRAGQWLVIARATVGVYASGVDFNTGHPFNGYFWGLDSGPGYRGSPSSGDFWQGFLSAGQTIYAKAATGSQGGGTLYLDLWFIPTADYPG
jgi:hypothetical protein